MLITATAITAAKASDAAAYYAVMQVAVVHAAAINATLAGYATITANTTCTNDEGLDADLNIVAKRCCYIFMSSAPTLILKVTRNQHLHSAYVRMQHLKQVSFQLLHTSMQQKQQLSCLSKQKWKTTCPKVQA